MKKWLLLMLWLMMMMMIEGTYVSLLDIRIRRRMSQICREHLSFSIWKMIGWESRMRYPVVWLRVLFAFEEEEEEEKKMPRERERKKNLPVKYSPFAFRYTTVCHYCCVLSFFLPIGEVYFPRLSSSRWYIYIYILSRKKRVEEGECHMKQTGTPSI